MGSIFGLFSDQTICRIMTCGGGRGFGGAGVSYWVHGPAMFDNRQYIDRMLPSHSEKKNLIEAMKKLTYQISNNPPKQKQIFESLSANDILKIVNNLYDDNEYLRRISALLLCELLYNCPDLKLAFAHKINLPLASGRVCVNRIPDLADRTPADLRRCIELMKSPLRRGETGVFCWAINLDKKHLDLEMYQFKKYSSFTFLDPLRTIFGFTLTEPEQEHEIPKSPATIETLDPRQILTDRLQKKQNPSRQSSKDSKFLYQGYDKRYSLSTKNEFLRPSTTGSSREKDLIASSKEKLFKFIKHTPEPAKMTTAPMNATISGPYSGTKAKMGTSIQSISQYARNSYGRQATDRQAEKERFSLSFQQNEFVEGNRIQTDRYEARKSTPLQSSAGKTRLSSGQKSPQTHHQNFYKRVQEILRK